MTTLSPAGIPDAFWRDPVERAKSDPAAFGELYDRYAGQIYRFVRARIRDDGLAEDITMEEIGAVLGKSPAAAKLLIYRAMQRLRRDLAPAEPLALAS